MKPKYHIGVCFLYIRLMFLVKPKYHNGVCPPYVSRMSTTISGVCSPYVCHIFADHPPYVRYMSAVCQPYIRHTKSPIFRNKYQILTCNKGHTHFCGLHACQRMETHTRVKAFITIEGFLKKF